MSGNEVRIEYVAEPTGVLFHHSDAFVRGLMGPIGSGKSVTCLQEIFRLGALQRPGRDGIRRTRWAVIRNTYPELKTTTLRSFLDWFGPFSKVKMNSPIEVILQVEDIWIEYFFIALDKEADIKKLKSLELTGVFINEASEISEEVLKMATGRVARYPAKRDGGATRSCVIMDTNPPDDDHWWYRLFEEDCPDNYELFKQPPALLKIKGRSGHVYVPNPAAENVKHQQLGHQYWLQQVPGKNEQWIDVFIGGQYGTSQQGRPCYPSYNDAVHCASEVLKPLPGSPILLGWDYGRTPVCIIGQMSPRGQLRILDEICVDPDGQGMGIRKFTRDVVKPFLDTHYVGYSFLSWGDPAGGAAGQGVEESCYDLQGIEGIPTESARSNDIAYRLENVDYFLLRLSDGEPGFLLSPNCKSLRKGFNGGYQFERVQVSGDARYKDKPMKNKYSHPHDGLQYLCDLAKHGITSMTSTAVAQPIIEGVSPAGWS